MKTALIGASGNVGSRIAAELSSRSHQITAIARIPGKIAALPGIRPTAVDIADTESLAAILKGHAAVISSVHFTASDHDQLIRAVKASAVPRYLVVGGAGPSCRHRMCSSPASARENSASVRMTCSWTTRAAASRSKTLPLPSETK
jgi:putative NADH-flavin reductase